MTEHYKRQVLAGSDDALSCGAAETTLQSLARRSTIIDNL